MTSSCHCCIYKDITGWDWSDGTGIFIASTSWGWLPRWHLDLFQSFPLDMTGAFHRRPNKARDMGWEGLKRRIRSFCSSCFEQCCWVGYIDPLTRIHIYYPMSSTGYFCSQEGWTRTVRASTTVIIPMTHRPLTSWHCTTGGHHQGSSGKAQPCCFFVHPIYGT